jgi:hypothetical protein
MLSVVLKEAADFGPDQDPTNNFNLSRAAVLWKLRD